MNFYFTLVQQSSDNTQESRRNLRAEQGELKLNGCMRFPPQRFLHYTDLKKLFYHPKKSFLFFVTQKFKKSFYLFKKVFFHPINKIILFY